MRSRNVNTACYGCLLLWSRRILQRPLLQFTLSSLSSVAPATSSTTTTTTTTTMSLSTTTNNKPSFSPSTTSSTSQYVMEKVKTHDYENYLCLMLSPKTWRYPAFIMHAFNVELSLAMDNVTDTRAATGRFAFWKDSIERTFTASRPFEHPIAIEMHRLYSSGLLTSSSCHKWLSQMITAREKLSLTTHVDTLENLEMYAEHTRSSLLYCILSLTGTSDLNTDHAASHLGKCQGLVTALRAMPYLASKNQIHLPQDLLSKHKVSQTDVIRARSNVREPVFDQASAANLHFQKCQSLMDKIPLQAKPVFIPSIISENYLEKLRINDFNLFEKCLQRRNYLLPWQLWRGSKKFS